MEKVKTDEKEAYKKKQIKLEADGAQILEKALGSVKRKRDDEESVSSSVSLNPASSSDGKDAKRRRSLNPAEIVSPLFSHISERSQAQQDIMAQHMEIGSNARIRSSGSWSLTISALWWNNFITVSNNHSRSFNKCFSRWLPLSKCLRLSCSKSPSRHHSSRPLALF